MTENHKTGCVICGDQLVYMTGREKVECFYCHESFDTDVKCVKGHFVCDKCHSLAANELIRNFCVETKLENPVEITLTLMKNPKIKMHGPEHHFLVPAALLAAYYNIKRDDATKELKIREAEIRASKVLGGFCGSHGNCGAAVGTGILISLVTNSTPLSADNWRLCNLMTAKSLLSISNYGGPRCCKRDTFLSLIEATDLIRSNFSVNLNIDKNIVCGFSPLNRECLKEKCPFYPANKK